MDVSERAGIEIPEKSVENPLKIGETFITANTVQTKHATRCFNPIEMCEVRSMIFPSFILIVTTYHYI